GCCRSIPGSRPRSGRGSCSSCTPRPRSWMARRRARSPGHDESPDAMEDPRMRYLLVAVCVLLLPSASWAANKTCPTGVLTPTPLVATGPSADTVTARAAPALAFQAVNTAGTATVEIQLCCTGSCDAATGAWAQVEGSPMTLTVSTAAQSVTDPPCQYRAVDTARTGVT